ncbi:MAG TPA: hypothetical protein DDZ51_09120 [Planctomycetaceae bacterium]|nr:hypothetical protein [Planctomycetaceae bacterium]
MDRRLSKQRDHWAVVAELIPTSAGQKVAQDKAILPPPRNKQPVGGKVIDYGFDSCHRPASRCSS